MNFDKTFNQWYFTESVLDIPRDGLDTTVFQFPEEGAPILHPRIRSQIINDLTEVQKLTPITDYFLIGSILTPKYTSTCDIDVTVEISSEISPIKFENLVSLLKQINGKLAVGTMHPINYYFVKGDYNLQNTEAAYDIANEKWIKEPSTTSFNAKRYINRMKAELKTVDLATAELRRDLIDFTELKKLSKDEISTLDYEVKNILAEIESSIDAIIQVYDNAKTLRQSAFNKALTPAEIRKFGSKNNLPENILYKLLERYYFTDFVNRLRDIVDDGVTKDNVATIKRTFKDFISRM